MEYTARLTGLTRSFRSNVAVNGLDLELRPGKIYGLLGPNGSGKTTTLRCMLGLLEPDSGTVELLGGPPNDAARARVGFTPEKRGLPETARVVGLLTFFARMRGQSRAEAKRLAGVWIERMELGDKATERIKTLSNGQQQKVQIALSLLAEPDLILLDEPLAALDPKHQELVNSEIRTAVGRGATVLLSTHRLREAQEILDHVVMLYRGTKVLDQPLDEALEEAFDGTWRVRADGAAQWVEGPEVQAVDRSPGEIRVRLREGSTVGPLLARAAEAAAEVRSIERVLPSLHELYLARAGTWDEPDEGS